MFAFQRKSDLKNRQESRRNVKRATKGRMLMETLEDRNLLAAVIYDDALQAPFQNWSWDTSVDVANTTPVHSGSHSLAASHNGAWAGLYLRNSDGVAVAANEEVRFQVHGGSGGQQINVNVLDGNEVTTTLATISPDANQWTEVVLDFAPSATPSVIRGLIFQDASGAAQNTFYVDQIEILDVVPEDMNDPELGPTITVDPSVVVREISEGVYGLNFADPAFADEIDLPLNRWGGNATTRYNFELDATNLASDFFYENFPADTPDVSALPAGSTANMFVNENESNGTETIMTIGMTGWTPNSRDIQGSFPVDVYGPQQEVNMYRPNHGNGIDLNGNFIQNDPTITSNPVDEQFAADWVNHLVSQHGTAANGGVQYYALDNEPMLWNSTHRDVHPAPASYDEVLDKGVAYANAIKTADPTAETLGPVSWGWTSYFYSALDAAGDGAWWENPLDRNAHGGTPFLEWYLQEMAAAETTYGHRLLDYLDIHFYPQDEGVALTSAGDLATQQDRLRSTRSLFDPTYTDTSWIDDEVQLVPRMRDWIDNNYPGTKLAITEYNWGGVEHISGALAQADVLGIMGREGVDLATMWAPPEPDQPAAYSFRMFRNYDGQQDAGSKFGETSLQALTTDVDDVSVFASERASDGALTIMLVNKSTSPQITPVNVAGVGSAVSEVYTYDGTNPNQIVRASDLAFVADQAEITLPAYSITMLEIPGEPHGLTGDFDGDGLVNVVDINALCAEIRSGSNSVAFDLNSDGQVNSSDMDVMILDVVGTLYGDANLDFVVNGQDYVTWNTHKFTANDSWGAGDFNCDGFVNGQDFIIWNTYKFQSAADQITFDIDRTEVPELFYDEVTVNANVCESGEHTVIVDGSEVPYTDNGDGTIAFNTAGTDHTITVRGNTSCAGFGDVETARLKDNLAWAYSHGFDDNVGLHASIDEFYARDMEATLFLIGEIFDDSRDEGWIVDLPKATEARAHGFSIGGHGWSSGCDDANTPAVTQVMDHLQDRFGDYQVTSFAAPCFVSDYHPVVLGMRDAGHRIRFNESGDNFFMDPDNFDFDAPVGRDWRYELGLSAIQAEIDTAASSGLWYNTLAHGGHADDTAEILDYLQTFDDVWIAPSDEIYSYLIVRENVIINQ